MIIASATAEDQVLQNTVHLHLTRLPSIVTDITQQ